MRIWCRSSDYGQRDELRLAPDEGSGYVWRLVTFARFEERNGGLYLELEVVALSREFSGRLDSCCSL